MRRSPHPDPHADRSPQLNGWLLITKAAPALIGLGSVPLAAVWLLGPDAGSFLIWWLMLAVLGWMIWPLSARIVPVATPGAGYLPAKTTGLAMIALIYWTAGYLLKWPLSRIGILLLILLIALIAWLPGRNRAAFQARCPYQSIVVSEVCFAFLLLVGTYARSLKPELDSLEKFMNVAFVNSILRSPGLPAADPWFAGQPINYYYFGHYAYALLTRLSGLRAETAVNLGVASAAALVGSLGLSIGQVLIRLTLPVTGTPVGLSSAASHRVLNSIRLHGRALVAGVLSLSLVLLAGNGQAFFYSSNAPGSDILRFLSRRGIEVGDWNKPYWFPDATRLIGYNPETTDKTIHEFPFYSFLVADLHAHVMNLAFVLLLLLILIGLAVQSSSQFANTRSTWGDRRFHWIGPRPDWPRLIAAGLLLGLFRMGNFWDFVIYLPLTLLALVSESLTSLSPATNRFQTVLVWIRRTAVQALVVLGIAALITRPFNSWFEPMSSQVAWVTQRTPAIQLAILWAAPVMAGCIGFVLLAVQRSNWRAHTQPLTASRQSIWQRTDWIALAGYIYALALIAGPELIYVVDIYSGDYKRANTVFKLTYQAFVLLGLVWGYLLVRVWPVLSNDRRVNWLWIPRLLMIILLIIPAWYPPIAVHQWLGDLSRVNRVGLDGLVPLGLKNSTQVPGDGANELADDLAAIAWLNESVAGQPVVLEAAGTSYSDAARIATFTGLPTVLGWETHEWLWRTSADVPDAYATRIVPRQQDIRSLYTTTDPVFRRQLIDRYAIKYIIVGSIEQAQYGAVDWPGLEQMGQVVWEQPTLKIIKTGASH